MPASPQSEHLRLRQVVIWTAFAAALAVGIALWFRFGTHIVPMLDVLTDR